MQPKQSRTALPQQLPHEALWRELPREAGDQVGETRPRARLRDHVQRVAVDKPLEHSLEVRVGWQRAQSRDLALGTSLCVDASRAPATRRVSASWRRCTHTTCPARRARARTLASLSRCAMSNARMRTRAQSPRRRASITCTTPRRTRESSSNAASSRRGGSAAPLSPCPSASTRGTIGRRPSSAPVKDMTVTNVLLQCLPRREDRFQLRDERCVVVTSSRPTGAAAFLKGPVDAGADRPLAPPLNIRF